MVWYSICLAIFHNNIYSGNFENGTYLICHWRRLWTLCVWIPSPSSHNTKGGGVVDNSLNYQSRSRKIDLRICSLKYSF